MDVSTLKDVIAVPASLFAALVSLITVGMMWAKRRHELSQVAARSHVALDVQVCPRAVKLPSGDVLLQTEVVVQNKSGSTFAVPAVYIWGRSLSVSASDGQTTLPTKVVDVNQLRNCFPLSDAVDATEKMRRTVVSLAPGETERFVRWDQVDSSFVACHPVVVMACMVYTGSWHLVGEQDGRFGVDGRLRAAWIDYMEERRKACDGGVPFGRRLDGRGTRILLLGDGSEDEPNTASFKEFLETVAGTSSFALVQLVDNGPATQA